MERISGTIRSLVWGIIPTQTFVVRVKGKVRVGAVEYEISEIVEDTNTFIELGYYEYLVYVVKINDVDKHVEQDKKFWCRYSVKPDKIEYFLPEEMQSLSV